MKRYFVISVSLLAVVLMVWSCGNEAPTAVDQSAEWQPQVLAKKGGVPAKSVESTEPKCTTIQDGTLLASDGSSIELGFDDWGYNYQGRMFKGYYCDSYRDAAWCQDYKDVKLTMKWNDAWLSNKDCDGDELLDRHFGFEGYVGSGAWLTNHQSGEYIDANGETIKWNYFVKIVAVPEDAVTKTVLTDDDPPVEVPTWYTADGVEIGEVIWGAFAIVQQVENDPGAGLHGRQYVSPAGAGLGKYRP
jgi:hypothetical protein